MDTAAAGRSTFALVVSLDARPGMLY